MPACSALVGPQFDDDARSRALLEAGRVLTAAHDLPSAERRRRCSRWWAGRARVVGPTFSANLTPMLAGKEIKRAKLRFGLLSGAVGLLVFLILFQQALLGSLLLSFTGALENQSGTVLVFSEEARKNVAGSVILPPQQAQIAAVDGVGASAPLGEGTFTIEADGEDTDASVFGFEPGGPGRAHPPGRGPPAHRAERGGRLQGGRRRPGSASATPSPASTATSRSPSSGSPSAAASPSPPRCGSPSTATPPCARPRTPTPPRCCRRSSPSPRPRA